MRKTFSAFVATVAVVSVFASVAKAADSNTNTAPTGKTGHGKNLNFDGDYVETMGKSPLDSLTALSESQKGRDSHLYKKRTEFAPETVETLKQSRFEQ